MPEVVLDELERGAGVQEVCGYGVPERVGREVAGEAGPIPIAHKTKLDLAAPQWSRASREQWLIQLASSCLEVATQQPSRSRKHDLLAPCSTFEPPHEQTAPLDVDVASPQEENLADPEAVVVHGREESAIAQPPHGCEEAPDLVLGQVPRRPLMGMRKDGQLGEGNCRSGLSAWIS